MGIINKTARRLGFIKPKFKPIQVLFGDYWAFKALAARQKLLHYDMFHIILKFYIEELEHNYRQKYNELQIRLPQLLVIIAFYEEKYGKLFKPPAKK